MSDRILQVVPAAAGWRKLSALTGYEGDLSNPEIDDIIGSVPVACFALIEIYEHGEPEQRVRAVYPEDFPSFLWVDPDDGHESDLGFLGPGEEIDAFYVKEAVKIIQKHRDEERKEGAS